MHPNFYDCVEIIERRRKNWTLSSFVGLPSWPTPPWPPPLWRFDSCCRLDFLNILYGYELSSVLPFFIPLRKRERMAGRKEITQYFGGHTQELIFSFNSLNHPTRVAFSSPISCVHANKRNPSSQRQTRRGSTRPQAWTKLCPRAMSLD